MNRFLQILLLLALLGILALLLYKTFAPTATKVTVCPVNAISMAGGKAVIDASKCIGCRRCVDSLALPTVTSKPPLATPQVTQPEPVTASVQPEELSPASLPNPGIAAKTVKTDKTQTPKPDKALPATHKVNATQCIGCTLCVRNCPTNAITMVDGKAVIDRSKCINCGICVSGNGNDFAGCPVNAISAP